MSSFYPIRRFGSPEASDACLQFLYTWGVVNPERENDLIRVRGQSLLYALHDLYEGLQEWEVLTAEHKSHNPRPVGAMVPQPRLEVGADLSLRVRYGAPKFDPDAVLRTPTIPRPKAASHFVVWVPDDRLGDTASIGILKHCLVVTPSRLEMAEHLLHQAGLGRAYWSYLAAPQPIKVFYVSQGRLKPSPQSSDTKRPAVRRVAEALGKIFLRDSGREESEMDAADWQR